MMSGGQIPLKPDGYIITMKFSPEVQEVEAVYFNKPQGPYIRQ